MQPLQPAFLNNFALGKTPLFIIAPSAKDGESLAIRISENLVFKDTSEFSYSKTAADNNYFNNNELTKVIAEFKEHSFKKSEDVRTTLKLLLEIGINNNKLLGLLCDYETFFELQLNTLFPDSCFAFIYDEDTYNSLYAGKINDFLIGFPTISFSLQVNNILYMSGIILNALPLSDNISIKQIDSPGENPTSLIPQRKIVHADLPGLQHQLNENNLLVKSNTWFGNAKNILFIFIISSEHIKEELLSEKLFQLYNSFPLLPEVHILCNNDARVNNIEAFISHNYPGFLFNKYSGNVAASINTIIDNSAADYIIVDNLHYQYYLANILTHFKKDIAPVFAFAGPLITHDRKLSLTDILITGMNMGNIAFPKRIFDVSGQFDNSLAENEVLWDFSIKTLQHNNGFAVGIKATVNDLKKNASIEDNNDLKSFDNLADKYSSVLVNNIKQVLVNIHNTQLTSENQIYNSGKKIANQQLLLNQSIDEVKSLTDLNLSMQRRLNVLESRWYYKLAQKLKHFKGIFFKKSTAGTSSLKKIIKFILFTFSKPGFRVLRKIIKGIFKKLYLFAEDRPVNIIYLDTSEGNVTRQNYNSYITEILDQKRLNEEYQEGERSLKTKPKISVLLPVYNPKLHFLRDAIESVTTQLYDNWELCIADDFSNNPQIKRLLNAYAVKDKRIKIEYRSENGHISAASNSALDLATGDFILLLDHDDTLTQNCLFEMAKYVNANPDSDVVYSDEDKLSSNGIYIDPFFKPDWSPDKLMAINYVSHALMIRRELAEQVGRFRLGFEGSQDYDLLLRCTEQARHIGHIPKILYHWRIHELSVSSDSDVVKPYAYIAGKKALEAALVRRNMPGEVQYTSTRGSYRIKYQVKNYERVSIIIPTKDAVSMMKNTIDSILELTEYPNYEIIVLNNNSTSKEFFDLMNEYTQNHGNVFRCVDATFPFNFSKLMNLGASLSTGKYLLMLNNDIEIIRGDWVTWMVSYAQNKTTGAVGVKLLYPDNRIQHAGTVIGFGNINIAGHVFVGHDKDAPGYFNQIQMVTNYAAVTAACLMCRKSIFDEVGGMDEALEIEYNDVDFCLKIIDKGYYNVYLPDVVLYHYESATRGHPHQDKKSYDRHIREVNYFREKWEKYIKKDPFYNPNLNLKTDEYTINYDNTIERSTTTS